MLKTYKLPLTNSNLLYIIPGVFALFSVLIVNPPMVFDDLYRFYDYYDRFRGMPVKDFFKFLNLLSDYLLPISVYIFSKIGIPVNFLLGVVNYFTVFIILKVSYLILNKNNKNIITPVFITTAISIPGLLSGVRNLQSIAIAYLAIYLLINSKYLKSGLAYLVSLLAHFSAIFYIIVPILLNVKFKKIYFFWLFSLLGFVLPLILPSYLNDDFTYSSTPLIAKIQHYILLKDPYYNLSYDNIKILAVTFIKLSWYIFVLIFLFFQAKKNTVNVWVKVLFIFSILMNFLFTYLTVFERISFFTKILFVVCFIKEETISNKTKNIIFIYFLILFVFQIALFVEGLFDFIKV